MPVLPCRRDNGVRDQGECALPQVPGIDALLRAFGRSAKLAGEGIRWGWRTQRNLRIQVVAAILVAVAAVGFRASAVEAGLLVTASACVLGLELMNTAVEALCDEVTTDRRESIKRIKDASAGAVAIAALGAAGTGLLVFGHHLIEK